MRKLQSGWKKGMIGGMIFILFFLLLLFLGKEAVINHYVTKALYSVEQKSGLKINYENLKIAGFSDLELHNLSVVPAVGCDTLLKAGKIGIQISFWKFLGKQIDISRVDADDIALTLIKRDSVANFDFLYRSRSSTDSVSVEKSSYSKRLDRILDALLGVLPADANIRKTSVSYMHNTDTVAFSIPSFVVKDHCFQTEIISYEKHDNMQAVYSHWGSKGILKGESETVKACLYRKQGEKIPFPFLEYRFNARLEFDTLSFEFSKYYTREDLTLKGNARVSGLTLFQPRISPENVFLGKAVFDYLVHVGNRSVELDSATTVTFDKLVFHPYLKIEKNPGWHLTASVDESDFLASDLFDSLPVGLFDNLEGMRVSGDLSYRFLLDVDMVNLDSLKFESDLVSRNFKILQYGKTDLRKMNGAFMYTAYEKGNPVRSFELGESNPSFRKLESISPLLQMAVMQSEDGAFYYHKGFLIDCIREALIQDIRERRFARGGSTISMQLVKNVFLNRNKTIARKLEEALIVWLIESNRLTSKQRMYEVYLNIAEWGPHVYGAEEASRYYFAKGADQLNVNEAIFLASLIPHPRQARYSFTDSLTLRPSLGGYFKSIAHRLQVKGLITESEAEQIRPDVILSGRAKKDFSSRVSYPDTLSRDTIPVSFLLVPKKPAAKTNDNIKEGSDA